MKKIATVQFLFYSLMLFLRVNAEDIQSVKQKNLEKALQCAEDYPSSQEDKELSNEQQMPDSEEAKCLLACKFKALGMMDDHGMLSVDGVKELGRLFLSENPEVLNDADHFIDVCLNVNDVEVSDGDKGCERAALIYKCGQEKVPGFGIG